MPLADFKIVLVMRRSDLYNASSELWVHAFVRNDGKVAALYEWMNCLTLRREEATVARVLRVDGKGHIAQQGLGPRRAHCQLFSRVWKQNDDIIWASWESQM